jgi:hypothetical protein
VRIFNFDPSELRERYASDQFVHVPDGVTPEFLEAMREFVARSLGARKVEGKAIAGAKDQAIFEFPAEADFPGEVFDVVAELGGLDRDGMTLSERHVKAYFDDAAPEPTAHKDRYSSQISVGLSIDTPPGSKVVLYPEDDREVNPFNVSGALIGSLPPERHPDEALRGAREVEIDDRPGDVVAFPGSSVWHLRRNPAGAVILYLKFNDFNSDPLGEDPATPARRDATVAALSDGALDARVPVPSRRLDTITRRYLRDGWQEVIEADVWERQPLRLGEFELALLRGMDGQRTVGELLDAGSAEDAAGRLRELAEREVIDLL